MPPNRGWPMEGDYIGYPSGEESALKRQQKALDEIAHLVEDCNNRLTLKSLNIAERYVRTEVEICYHFRIRESGEDIQLIYRAIRGDFERNHFDRSGIDILGGLGGIGLNQSLRTPGHVLPQLRTEHQQIGLEDLHVADKHRSANVNGNGLHPMFISAVELVDVPKKVVPSTVRLGCRNEVEGVARKLFMFSKLGFEHIFIPPEREIDPRIAKALLDVECRDKVIQGGPDIMQDFANNYGKVPGDGVGKRGIPHLLSALRIELGRQTIRVSTKKTVGSELEFIDLGFGPFDLGEARRERRFRFHDIESVMSKNDVTKDPEFQRVLGNLLKMPPKPHSKMKLGKRNPKKAKSRQRDVSAKTKTA